MRITLDGTLAILNSKIVTNLYYNNQYYFSNSPYGEVKATMFMADLDGDNVHALNEVISDPYSADENYLYKWTMWSGGEQLSEKPGIWIFDKEGNLLVEFNVNQELPIFQDIYVSPGEYVFIYASKRIYYFSKKEISTGEIHPKVFIDLRNIKE